MLAEAKSIGKTTRRKIELAVRDEGLIFTYFVPYWILSQVLWKVTEFTYITLVMWCKRKTIADPTWGSYLTVNNRNWQVGIINH